VIRSLRRYAWWLLAAATGTVAAVVLAVIWGQPPPRPKQAVERLNKIHLGMARDDVDRILVGLEGQIMTVHGSFSRAGSTEPPQDFDSIICQVSDDWSLVVSFDKDAKVIGRDIALQGKAPWHIRLLESLKRKFPWLRGLPFLSLGTVGRPCPN
jgi:hypothetical protein